MRLQKVTSRENQRLVHARKVRDGKVEGLLFIEGRRLVGEALRSELKVVECFIAEDLEDRNLIDKLENLDADVVQSPSSLFRSITDTAEPQGIIILAERPTTSFTMENWRNVKVPIYLFLKEVNNPSNLGAILRSVEAAGAGGVFISKKSADVYSPKSLRASMGAAFRVAVQVDADLSDVVIEAGDVGVNCVALAASVAKSYLDVNWTKPHLLVYGSEAHGLTEEEVERAGEAISIPMEASVESLNLAVAAGIVLFEARRQAYKVIG